MEKEKKNRKKWKSFFPANNDYRAVEIVKASRTNTTKKHPIRNFQFEPAHKKTV